MPLRMLIILLSMYMTMPLYSGISQSVMDALSDNNYEILLCGDNFQEVYQALSEVPGCSVPKELKIDSIYPQQESFYIDSTNAATTTSDDMSNAGSKIGLDDDDSLDQCQEDELSSDEIFHGESSDQDNISDGKSIVSEKDNANLKDASKNGYFRASALFDSEGSSQSMSDDEKSQRSGYGKEENVAAVSEPEDGVQEHNIEHINACIATINEGLSQLSEQERMLCILKAGLSLLADASPLQALKDMLADQRIRPYFADNVEDAINVVCTHQACRYQFERDIKGKACEYFALLHELCSGANEFLTNVTMQVFAIQDQPCSAAVTPNRQAPDENGVYTVKQGRHQELTHYVVYDGNRYVASDAHGNFLFPAYQATLHPAVLDIVCGLRDAEIDILTDQKHIEVKSVISPCHPNVAKKSLAYDASVAAHCHRMEKYYQQVVQNYNMLKLVYHLASREICLRKCILGKNGSPRGAWLLEVPGDVVGDVHTSYALYSSHVPEHLTLQQAVYQWRRLFDIASRICKEASQEPRFWIYAGKHLVVSQYERACVHERKPYGISCDMDNTNESIFEMPDDQDIPMLPQVAYKNLYTKATELLCESQPFSQQVLIS